jgi:ATP/ADP translocase
MYGFLSLLTGVVIAVMVMVNGCLTARHGIFHAAVIAVLLLMGGKDSVFDGISFQADSWIYLGGILGVTVLRECFFIMERAN